MVLAGGRDYLAQHRPPIVAEYNLVGIQDGGLAGEDYLGLYRDLGYTPHYMPRPWFGWHRWARLCPVETAERLPDLCNLVMLPR
jgi:hypothetical protein